MCKEKAELKIVFSRVGYKTELDDEKFSFLLRFNVYLFKTLFFVQKHQKERNI